MTQQIQNPAQASSNAMIGEPKQNYSVLIYAAVQFEVEADSMEDALHIANNRAEYHLQSSVTLCNTELPSSLWISDALPATVTDANGRELEG